MADIAHSAGSLLRATLDHLRGAVTAEDAPAVSAVYLVRIEIEVSNIKIHQ